MTPATRDLLKQMDKTPYGKALREYLGEKVAALQDISTVQTWEETIGRKHAVTLIKDLFKVLDDAPEVVSP